MKYDEHRVGIIRKASENMVLYHENVEPYSSGINNHLDCFSSFWSSQIQDLDLYGILEETEKRGISFDQLLTIPENDDWVYSDGKSTTCVAFILSMYKAAGIFGPFADSIQVTEFTVSHQTIHPSSLTHHSSTFSVID